MKVAIGQVAPVVGELQANLDRTRELTTQAVAEGAKLVVFPELNLSGYFTPPQLGLAATDQRLRAATVGAGDAAVLLGFPELDNGVTYNSAALYIAGELRHVHRKLILPSYHPFTEDERFRPGNALHTFNTPFGRAAVLLCEDAVQPALATVAAHDGAELLLIPASSAHSLQPEISNREHWHAVTSFYARLTQTFVVFANRAGEEAPFRFWGGLPRPRPPRATPGPSATRRRSAPPRRTRPPRSRPPATTPAPPAKRPTRRRPARTPSDLTRILPGVNASGGRERLTVRGDLLTQAERSVAAQCGIRL